MEGPAIGTTRLHARPLAPTSSLPIRIWKAHRKENHNHVVVL